MPRAEAAAQRVRRDAGTSLEVWLDVEAIAEKLGAEVIFDKLGDDVSGLLVREADRVVIGVNDAHPETRQRFTIAHELGHLVLHQGHRRPGRCVARHDEARPRPRLWGQ